MLDPMRIMALGQALPCCVQAADTIPDPPGLQTAPVLKTRCSYI
jgi:hypothetical protein